MTNRQGNGLSRSTSFCRRSLKGGDDLMQWCEKFKLEGVVSKKRDAPYVSGECKAWVKSEVRGMEGRE